MPGKETKNHGHCFREKIRNCFGRRRCSAQVSPLSKSAGTGRVKVCKITGDRRICARMASMGLYPGVEADIICSETGSQCLLKVNGGTISLDSDVSEKVFVSSV